jgi:hypothetical protein
MTHSIQSLSFKLLAFFVLDVKERTEGALELRNGRCTMLIQTLQKKNM